MNRTAKVRQSLHCLADALEAVLTHAKIVGSLHRALAEACDGRRLPEDPEKHGVQVRPEPIGVIEAGEDPRRAARRPIEPLEWPDIEGLLSQAGRSAPDFAEAEWQEVAGLLPQLESAWHALRAPLKAAEDLTRETEGPGRGVDLVAIQAALKAIGEHYGPHSYGFRLGLPQLGEANLVFTGRISSEPPDDFLDGVTDLSREARKLRIKAPAAETIDDEARKSLTDLEWKVWQAIPGKDGPRVTCVSMAKRVKSTEPSVRTAIRDIRRKLGAGAILVTKGNRSTYWRPDIQPR